MGKGVEQKIDCLLDHYFVVNLLLALIILTYIGVGNVKIVSLLGLLLCAAGFLRVSIRVDLWILVPLIVYNLISLASSYAAYGNITDGYGSTQTIVIILYLIMAGLDHKERLLLKRLCVVWTGAAALAGIVQFVGRVLFWRRAWRVGGLLGNPNAMGIFLVVGWFALLGCVSEREEGKVGWSFYLPYIEPILLAVLALTLSMGSFVAMAVGILALAWERRRRSSWKESFRYACCLLARATLGMGTGMLIYLAAARTAVPLSSLLPLFYAVAMVCCWKKYSDFLAKRPGVAVLISVLGVWVAIVAIIVRPSALATFAERLEMMENGLGYFARNPLLGVGPYQWRLLNLYDDGKYFNTWHIHNLFIHIGVELGWIALTMLVVVASRFYRKGAEAAEKAGFTAFCFHNMMDTSFFYLGILSLTMLTTAPFGGKTRELRAGTVRVIFVLSAALFVYHLYFGMRSP